MNFIIIEKKDFQKFKVYFFESDIREIDSPIFSDEYTMIHISGNMNDIFEFIKNESINANFCVPLLSGSSFQEIYSLKVLLKLNIGPKTYKYSDFEDIIAPIHNLRPQHKGQYIFLNEMKGEKVKIKDIEQINFELGRRSLYIAKEDYKISLFDIFKNTIADIIDKEIEEENIIIKIIEKRNKEYIFLVMAEFIIRASMFYKREEIEKFIEKISKD